MYVLGVYHPLYDVILAVGAGLLGIYIFYLLIRSDIEFNRIAAAEFVDRKHTEEIHTTSSSQNIKKEITTEDKNNKRQKNNKIEKKGE